MNPPLNTVAAPWLELVGVPTAVTLKVSPSGSTTFAFVLANKLAVRMRKADPAERRNETGSVPIVGLRLMSSVRLLVLPMKLLSPAYSALMVWLPCDRLVLVKLAMAEPLSAVVPNGVVP